MYNNITPCQKSQGISNILTELAKRKHQQEYFASKLGAAYSNTFFSSTEKLKRINECGAFIALKPDGKISGANFCKNKLCPLCQWRLSRKTFGKLAKMQAIVEERNEKCDYIFVTLTLRNMEHLYDGVNAIIKAFYRFSNDRTFKSIHNGFTRTMEVTYSSKNNTWHPHIHMIVAVKEDYFQKRYLRRATWARLWQRALRVNYIPQVDVRKITEDSISEEDKKKIKTTSRVKAVAEIAKYAVKPFDLKEARADETELYTELLEATYHRRLRSFAGVYKEAAKIVGLTEDENLTDDVLFSTNDFQYVYKNGEYVDRLNLLNKDTGEVNGSAERVIIYNEMRTKRRGQ